MAKKAYQLGGNGQNVVAAADYGLMLKEYLSMMDEKFQEANQDQYRECVRVFKYVSILFIRSIVVFKN